MERVRRLRDAKGIPVRVAKFVPKGQLVEVGGAIYMNPADALFALHPNSPVYSRLTLGHKELERDQRRRRRANA